MAFDFTNWKTEVKKRDEEITRLKFVIDLFLDRLQKEADKWTDKYIEAKNTGDMINFYYSDGMSDAFEQAIGIVKEVIEENERKNNEVD